MQEAVAHPHALQSRAVKLRRERNVIATTRDRVQPAPTGGLSPHVLDTVRAIPAAGLGVELWGQDASGQPICLQRFTTDANGASSHDLLGQGRLRAGTYEWRYDTPT